MIRLCKIEGCNREIKGHSARGMCKNHYRKFLLYGDACAADQRKNRGGIRKCIVDGCDRSRNSHGYCRPHYIRLQKYGSPTLGHRKYATKHIREYRTWESMIERCISDRHPNYRHYGGRGIKVCERWRNGIDGFYNFLEDMGSRPKGMTLDRIDVDGDYCPENCRWADNMLQQNNKRNNHYITINGRTQSVTLWAREYEINPATAFSRIRKGENGERIFRQPWT